MFHPLITVQLNAQYTNYVLAYGTLQTGSNAIRILTIAGTIVPYAGRVKALLRELNTQYGLGINLVNQATQQLKTTTVLGLEVIHALIEL